MSFIFFSKPVVSRNDVRDMASGEKEIPEAKYSGNGGFRNTKGIFQKGGLLLRSV